MHDDSEWRQLSDVAALIVRKAQRAHEFECRSVSVASSVLAPPQARNPAK